MAKTLKEITESYGLNSSADANNILDRSTGPRSWDPSHPDHHWERAMEHLHQVVNNTKENGLMHRAMKAWDGDDSHRKDLHSKAKELLNNMIEDHATIVDRGIKE